MLLQGVIKEHQGFLTHNSTLTKMAMLDIDIDIDI